MLAVGAEGGLSGERPGLLHAGCSWSQPTHFRAQLSPRPRRGYFRENSCKKGMREKVKETALQMPGSEEEEEERELHGQADTCSEAGEKCEDHLAEGRGV